MKQVMFLLVAIFTIAFSGVSKANTYPTQTEKSYSIDQVDFLEGDFAEVITASEEVSFLISDISEGIFASFDSVLLLVTPEKSIVVNESINIFKPLPSRKESTIKGGVLNTQLKFLTSETWSNYNFANVIRLDGFINSFNQFNTYTV